MPVRKYWLFRMFTPPKKLHSNNLFPSRASDVLACSDLKIYMCEETNGKEKC